MKSRLRSKIYVVLNVLTDVIKGIGFFILFFIEKIFYPFPQSRKELVPVTVEFEDIGDSNIVVEKDDRNHELLLSLSRNFSKSLRQLYKRISSIKVKFPEKKQLFQSKIWVPQYTPTINYKKHNHFILGLTVFVFGVLFTVLFVLIPSHIYLILKDLPSPDLLVTKEIPTPTRILDRKGRLLYEIYVDKKFEPITIDKVPKNLINATLASEDADFYKHKGFSIKSMVRAAKSTLVDDKLQGGSTITQQLVKTVLLSQERTVERKIREIVLSVLVESKYSKNQIIELYLNNISYGGTAWGVQAASQKYFGKNVWELNLAESAFLAGLISAPSAYSQVTGDLQVVKGRQQYVLSRMYQLGYITNKEAIDAFNQQLVFVTQSEYIRAPHFVAFVRDYLEKEYGKRYIEIGGLTVKTSLDLDIQDKVQEIVKDEVAKSANLQISNGAAVVMDPKTGEILAYVGSIDYFKEKWGAYDVASAYRQPGSSIKPVTYALALENGYTPVTLIKDKAISFQVAGQAPYTPKNYDGKYHGDVTLRAALANSYNIPAVRLASKLGPDKIVQLGHDMGLRNWTVDGSYGLSVTLGGKEVRLVDHTNVFATLARLGVYKDFTPFISIKDRHGFEIYQDARVETQVVNKEAAYIIWNILSDNNARTPAFGIRNSLVIPNKTVAVKTGTTDLIRDNFTMGYTPNYVVGVWVGNNDNTPLNRNLASGISGAAPIWNRIMSELLKDKVNELFPRPEGVYSKTDDKCKVTDIFIVGTKVPERFCATPEKEKDKKD